MLWKPESTSMASAMVGRVMNTLLSARPKKLENAIVRLGEAPNNSVQGALEESLHFLNKYLKEAVEEKQSLDEVLVPMIENALKFKDSKHPNQAMMLLNWLFQDEALFTALANDLANIISRREDRYIALGWCRLVCSLVEYENRMAQFLKNGLRDNYQALLKILLSSVRHLLVIICNGSVLQDGFELPTRLAVSAADCVLVLSEALSKKPVDSRSPRERGSLGPIPFNKPISILEKHGEKKDLSPSVSNNVEGGYLLWQLLDQLIILVEKLHSWSQKSRPLHAKGLGQVLKWLREINNSYVCAQDEAGSQFQTTGVLLLASCWRYYSMLSRLEDFEFSQRCDELAEQYLSGIQFYTEDNAKDHMGNRDGCIETRKFFLNCLALLLGRLDHKRLENITSVYGLRMSNIIMSQLHCADEDVTNMALCILRSAILKISGSSIDNPREMETLLPPLMDLLDECDGAARAVTVLVAEYCSISSDDWCLKEILKRLACGNVTQRRNAADVISGLIRISVNSTQVVSGPFWQDIANQLLECLGDEDHTICTQANSLLPLIDPSLVLPTLARYICLTDDPMKTFASNAFAAVLRSNSQSFEVIRVLLDTLSNLCETSVHPQGSEGVKRDGSKFDLGEVFRIIPEWSKTVQDWTLLVEPLIDKMFSEPSNATIVRFLSCINEHLADTADIVLGRLLLRTREQEEIAGRESWALKNENPDCPGNMVFVRLCPLLIIKILPLRVFNDLHCATMYGQTLRECIAHGADNFDISNYECVATLLFNRAFCRFEYEDVRKLAAELCGRIHPEVLFPAVLSQLQPAAELKDVLNIKACLFAMCTSLAIRGWESVSHPYVIRVIGILQAILLWPSSDGDEVSKAHHGCIDCLALMICTELQAPKQLRDSVSDKSSINVQNAALRQSFQASALGSSVLTFVIANLANDKFEADFSLGPVEDSELKISIPVSVRLCMANVLISTCQKISEAGKKTFAKRTLPQIIHLTEVIGNAAVRAACVQVLFSAVYHLKLLIVPYAHDFLKLALKFLRKETEQERMAGARLMVSLMASEDNVAESIARELPEVRSTLLNVSTSDPSPQLRQICQQLLACLSL